MEYGRRARSPARSRRGHPAAMDNPHRASTGSLPGGELGLGRGPVGRMDDMGGGGGFPEGPGRGGGMMHEYLRYGNPSIHHHPPPHHHHPPPPPQAPLPPNSGQPTPYSTNPHSPTSSSENLNDYPPGPYGHPSPHHYGPAPQAPAPAPAPPPPQSAMRGGDGSLGRRNTTATTKPAIHHYEHPDAYHDNYRRHSPESSGGPFMVIPNSGGAIHRSQTYRPASSGYSDASYESGDIRSLGGAKGYMISAGRRSTGTSYHLDGPPRRRGRERSPDDYEYDEPMPPRRIASGQAPPPTMSGALVRSRSRSDSQGPPSGALVRRRSDDDDGSPPRPAPNNGTIRLEYGGQAIDIAYTGSNGKPLVGNITINTTARTVSIPASNPAPALESAPPALPAPPAQLALPPPPPPALPAGITPVMIPAPPPPGGGGQQQAPPSRRPAHSERDSDDTDYSHSPSGRDIYQSFANMSLEGAGPPTRGRQPMPAPAGGAPRPQSRPRAPSNPPPPGHEDPLWTKISRDIVSKRAVMVRGYDFEEVPNAIIIYRVLGEDEIDDLVDLSERIRTGKVELVRRERKPSLSSSSVSRRRSTSRRRRPLSHSGPLGPGPSKERPPPGKPAIVHANRGMPEAPPPPEDDLRPPPVTVTQTKGGMRDHGDMPGTYVGYRGKLPRQNTYHH